MWVQTLERFVLATGTGSYIYFEAVARGHDNEYVFLCMPFTRYTIDDYAVTLGGKQSDYVYHKRKLPNLDDLAEPKIWRGVGPLRIRWEDQEPFPGTRGTRGTRPFPKAPKQGQKGVFVAIMTTLPHR